MMAVQDCSPPYEYRPTFTPNGQCTAPGFTEKRARLFAGGTFFRSKDAGVDSNLIAIEFILKNSPASDVLLNVYNNTVLVETFDSEVGLELSIGSPCIPIVSPALRSKVNSTSQFIEMPVLDGGAQPTILSHNTIDCTSTPPVFPDPIFLLSDEKCAFLFGPTNLSGGDGPPEDDSTLASIRTGPERTLVIVQLSEICGAGASDTGYLYNPLAKGRQWDGTDWIQYVPNSDCACS